MGNERWKPGDEDKARVPTPLSPGHDPSAAKPPSPGIRPLIKSQPAPAPVQRTSLLTRLPPMPQYNGPLQDFTNAVFRPDLFQQPVQRQQSQTASQPATSQTSTPLPAQSQKAAPSPAAIDPPQPAINLPGFIDNDDGANIRNRPAELQGTPLTAQPLPPTTRVFVSGRHPSAPQWWYVSAFLPSAIVRGYVQHFRVTTDLPEPTAKLYQIKPGDTAERLAVQEFTAAVRPGHDLRYYENVLLAVNRDKNRAGIKGTFQDPNILGGGANNIQLEAGRRIWLVSPAYARALEGKVPDGSLTNGMYAKAQRVLGHIDDLVRSVTDSPRYFGTVAGEYAQAIKDHLPEIVGITAGFILAESASAFLAATPTGVGQLAAALIQLALAAFGAKFSADACTQALTHGEQWLTLAWTAHGDAKQLAAASQAFLKMLVSIAMAALAITGAHGNMGKGLKLADAIKIQPPGLGMSPALVTPSGQVIPGGPVFTPGSIATTGPVDIGPSLMAAVGSGGKESSGSRAGAAGNAAKAADAARGSLKWGNPKSTPTYGHTFSEHGAGAKMASRLLGEARGTGKPQGQWLDNQAAAKFLAEQRSHIARATTIDLPPGLGQVIRPDGTIVPARRVTLVPSPNGGYRTAFPVE